MSTTLLAAVVLVAALACPAHMLWQMRRGKRAASCVPTRPDELGRLRARQQMVSDELASRGEVELAPHARRRVGGKPG